MDTAIAMFGIVVNREELDKIVLEVLKLPAIQTFIEDEWLEDTATREEVIDYFEDEGYNESIFKGLMSVDILATDADMSMYEGDLSNRDFRIESRGHNANDRYHSLDADRAIDTYTLGVYCGSNGFGYLDEVGRIVHSPPGQDVISIYNTIREAIERAGISKEPEMHVVSQRW
jgi:hypothetical protein